MSNYLNTVLNDAGNRALVEEYLSEKLLDRKPYEHTMANSKFLDTRGIPTESGQYVRFTKKNRLRLPENMDIATTAANEIADPLSGASFGTEIMTVPMEYVHEYIGIGTIAGWTSMLDLDQWADEDLMVSLARKFHRNTQSAFVVGRYKPGQYDADGNVGTAFDTTVQRSFTMHGITFNFKKAPTYFANGRQAFGQLTADDRITWDFLRRVHTKLALAGAPKVNGAYVAYISESVKNDLIHDGKDGEYFATAIRNFASIGRKSLVDNQIADFAGFHFVIDDEPFTETLGGTENVRVDNGQVHSIIIMGKHAASYVPLNGKTTMRPKFKVQDLTKTGVLKTIGYLVPFQVAVTDEDWCAVIKTPVTEWLPNGVLAA